MHRINRLFFIFFVLLSTFHVAEAQVGQSPYTVKGIGSVNSLATGRNLGMGGVGIGTSHFAYLNNMNPANLSRNSFYTTFEAGLSVESRQLETLEDQHATSSGGLDYLSLAFPLLFEKWTMNLGLAPYSTVSYDMVTSRPIEGISEGTANYSFSGSGGTTQAYAATGFKVFKGLSAGLRASYVFGAITEEINNSVTGTGTGITYGSRYYSQTSFSDVLFTGGLAYRLQVPNKKDRFISAGFTYDLEGSLDATRTQEFQRIGSINASAMDETTEGSYFLPAKIGTGISLERLYRYTLAADFVTQNWEQYRNLEGSNESGLGKSYRAAIGGEWTPEYTSGTYYQRMTYRMGLQYEKTPIIIEGEDINDFGINFGLSLPVSNASSIHTSFLFGQRGTLENDLIRERYFRLSIGVTFNDRWFTKVKYD